MYSQNINQGPKLRKFWQVIIIIFITISIPLGLIALKMNLDTRTDAGPTENPEEVIISKISDQSFTVSFITPSVKTKSIIKYGKNKNDLKKTGFDDRGQEPFHVHYHKIDNLVPDTQYFFSIVIGDEVYESEEYQVKTTKVPSSIPVPIPINGKVISNDFEEGVVYAHLTDGTQNSTVISSLLPTTKAYALDISNAKTKNGETFPQDSKLVIFASIPKQGKGYIVTDPENQSLEDIKIDPNIDNYNPESLEYVNETQPTETSTPTSSPTLTQTQTSTPTPSFTPTNSPTPNPTEAPVTPTNTSIVTPSLEITSNLENFESVMPGAMIMGSAKPNSILSFKLENQNLGTSFSNSNGNWQFKLPEDIPPGESTLIITSEGKHLSLNVTIENFEDLPTTAIADYTIFIPSSLLLFIGVYLVIWIQNNNQWGKAKSKHRILFNKYN